MDNVKELLEAASKNDNFVACDFDDFLRENGFSEDDLSERMLMDELYFFFSCYYYIKYKKLPHRMLFAGPSKMLKLYRIRQRRGKYLPWGMRISKRMKESFLKFMERSEKWAKKFNGIKNAKKSHQARKVNRKESKQLENLLASRDSIKDSLVK